jgi:taurine transport system permease protein
MIGKGEKGRDRDHGWLLSVGAVVAFLILWWLLTELEVWDPLFLPRPSDVWSRFIESVTTSDAGKRGLSNYFLWEHLWASLWRLIQGIFFALLIGIPLGLLMATVPFFRRITEPFVDFIRSIPPLAYFSLLIIWFGIEDTSKIWLLFLAAVAPITLSVISGVEGVPKGRTDSARSLGANRWQTLVFVTLPSVMPELLTGLRLAIGFAFTTIVAAETVDGIPGIGGLAWQTKKLNQSDVAILCIIVIGLTAIALDRLVKFVERRLVPWRGSA